MNRKSFHESKISRGASLYDCYNMPVWRNGRRTGLKIPSSKERIGSSPITGTNP